MAFIFAFKKFGSLPEADRPLNGNGVRAPANMICTSRTLSGFQTEQVEPPGKPLKEEFLVAERARFQAKKDELEAEGFEMVFTEAEQQAVVTEGNAAAMEWYKIVVSPGMVIERKIASAASAGQMLVLEFGKRNVLAGKSDEEIDSIMEDPDMSKLMSACLSGSLAYARRKAAAMELPVGVTEDDREWFLNKLSALLGG